jgi:hypothetical protein
MPRDLWDRVHALMERKHRDSKSRWTHTHLLKGKLRTSTQAAMSPSTVQRQADTRGAPSGRERRISCHVSPQALKHGYDSCPIKSVNASQIDDIARGLVLDCFGSQFSIAPPRPPPSEVGDDAGWFERG